MLTKLYPMVQFKKNTWEIDEFDCASMFLLIGTEKAMLIDCGMGIGDLRGAIEMITDKPLIVGITHGHIDHTANGRQFDELWIHPKDQGKPIPMSLERRRYDTEHIAQRQKGHIGAPYNMFHLYPYDINVDLREPGLEEKMPVIHDLYDGQQFDLGGGRIVTAYECPGHSAGEMVFLDEATRSLFAGDAINFNLGIGAVPLEAALRYLRRIEAMRDQYDGIYNGHHDFRALGAPLDDDCLPNIIALCEEVLEGHYSEVTVPNFWGNPLPLTRTPVGDDAPPMTADAPAPLKRVMLCKGRNFLGINPDNIYEEK
jgi:hydroxyacylglutathione hydrolase